MHDGPDIYQELRMAWRSLWRTPAFTTVAVVILALGIGGITAVFSVVNQVLLTPLPYAEPGQLMRVYQTRVDEPDVSSYVSGPAFDAYRQMRSFEDVAGIFTYRELGADLTGAGGTERVQRLPVSAAYFDVLRAPPARGRGFLPEEELTADSRTAVISQELWQRRFAGAADIIGHTLVMDGEPFEIVGVAQRGFEDPVAGEVDVWVPHALSSSGSDPQNHFLTVIARLRGGTTIAEARSELQHTDAMLAQQYPQAADRPGRIVGLHEDTVHAASSMLYVLLGAVGLVLLIVCVNIANLLLARATAREREFAVRAALGSGRSRIVRQLLFESVLLGMLGGVAGVLLGSFLLDAIILLGSASVPRLGDAAFDGRVLAFSAAISIGSALLFGMLPALRFSRVAPGGVLRDSSRSVTADRGRNRLRSGLVGAQVALAFMLLASAAILLLSFHRLRNVELGIEPQNALTFEVHLPTARYDSLRRAAFHEEFATLVSGLGIVRTAGAVSRLPVTGGYHGWGSTVASGPRAAADDARIPSQQRVVAGDYFATMRIPLLAGRVFDTRDDTSVPRRVVISESAARAAFPGVDPIGQMLLVLGRPVEVIGVVQDVALTPEGEITPTVYHAHRQFAGNRNWPLTQVVRTHGDPMDAVPAIRAQLTALDPELVLHRPAPLADVVGQGVAQRRFTTWIMSAFASLAVLLATIGLFGVITYMVRQRRREIGIRAALGARPIDIQRMVVGQGLRVSLAGVAAGLVGALASSRLLQSLVFQTEPADPRVLAAAALGMAAITAIAAYLPAREATGIDPASVMQEE